MEGIPSSHQGLPPNEHEPLAAGSCVVRPPATGRSAWCFKRPKREPFTIRYWYDQQRYQSNSKILWQNNMSEICLNKYRVGILLRGNGSSDDDWNNCQSAILTTFFSVRTATSSRRSWTHIKLAWCKTRYCIIMPLHKHIFPNNIIWLDTYARWYSICYLLLCDISLRIYNQCISISYFQTGPDMYSPS